ncbi:MAG: RibD family protein, partial [Actinomycetota bacterium]|nr:RibD family protein [Actinomycetota bacterium]
RDVHRLRAGCDAIVVGTGTIRADDPHLTSRPDGSPLPRAQQPLRVIIGHSPLPRSARVLDAAADTVHLRTHDVAAVLQELFRRERWHVWLEGGPRLAGAFVAAGLVDEVVAYVAPVLLGAGPPALGDAGVGTIADAVRLEVRDVVPVGPDLRVTATPGRPAPWSG